MMECWVELGNGSGLWLPTALEWEFNYGTGLPCDSFRVRCLWAGGQEKLLSAAGRFYAQWKGERVFTGVVDEFAVVWDGEGRYLELSGRGMAARLLDNEALPMEYQKCTCADLVADHVAPYGIETVGGGGLPAVWGFSVDSGASEWSAVWDFACCYGGVVPRFDFMGRLVLDGHRDETVTELDGDVPVTVWEYREQRHGVLSRVGVRRRSTGELRWSEDPEFLAEGGCARRVVTVPEKTGTAAMRYTGEWQLKASRAERVRLTAGLPGAFFIPPGQLVQVDRAGIAGIYRVAQCKVTCGQKGLETVLTLGERDSLI